MSDPTPTFSKERESLLLAYVRRALSEIGAGRPVDPSQLCASHPELVGPVAEALGICAGLGTLQRAASAADPLAGFVLDQRYRLERRIGAGGMGVVYAATDLTLARPVAVKILQAHLLGDPEREQRFAAEAKALAALQHPHAVAIYDHGRSPQGMAFLVMPLLQGVSLAALIERAAAEFASPAEPGLDGAWVAQLLGQRPPESSYLRLVVRWCAELASAVTAAHAAGLLHRDLKPSNVVITPEAQAVLLDFGLVKRPTDPSLTGVGVVGSPWYMAPEQAMGLRLGPPADVYGLGATLYHAITLRPPFEGEASAVLLRLQTEDPLPAQHWHRRLPRDLQAIADHALERAPQRRYPTMAALEADLRAFLEHRPVSVRPLTQWERRWRRLKRAPAKTMAALALALALLTAATAWPLWLAEQRRERQQQRLAIRARLPLRLGFEGEPDQRPQLSERERTQGLRQLDALLQIDPGDVAASLLRAGLLLDQGAAGDAQRAADCVERVATTEYLRAVAARYRQFDPSLKGARSVKLDNLSEEPRSAPECYAAAFHELRLRPPGFVERAATLLDSAAKSYGPARELRLLVMLEQAQRAKLAGLAVEVERLGTQACADAIAVEVDLGRKTAGTRAAIGLAHLLRKRNRDAITELSESLAICPDQYGCWQNLGVVYARLNDLASALTALEHAQRLRPGHWGTLLQLAQVHLERGDYEQARAMASASQSDATMPAHAHAELLGNIATREASVRYRSADAEGFARLIGEAIAHYEAADQAAAGRIARIRRNLDFALAVRRQDSEHAWILLLQAVAGDPTNVPLLNNLATMAPQALGPDGVKAVTDYLQALAQELEFAPEARR